MRSYTFKHDDDEDALVVPKEGGLHYEVGDMVGSSVRVTISSLSIGPY